MICQHSVGRANALGSSQCLHLLGVHILHLGSEQCGSPLSGSKIPSWGNRTKHHLHSDSYSGTLRCQPMCPSRLYSYMWPTTWQK